MKKKELVSASLSGIDKKIAVLLGQKKISMEDLENFDIDERRYFGEVCTQMLEVLKDEQRDILLEKIEACMPAGNRQQIWEYNHQAITQAISRLTLRYGCMPNKTDLADETGLSRQTITKHLKEYKTHPQYVEEMEQFKMMAPEVMANLFRLAVRGDIRAARLYLDTVGVTNNQQRNTIVSNQNNYIQINNTILSQENLKRLSAEQLNQIESVVAMVLPEGVMAG